MYLPTLLTPIVAPSRPMSLSAVAASHIEAGISPRVTSGNLAKSNAALLIATLPFHTPDKKM